jgi:DNA-binding MarR family transcriptional regulator
MTAPEAGVDVDRLPLTQLLVLEVLAARARAGDDLWTLPARATAAVDMLASLGLVEPMHGAVEHTIRASLTDAGRRAMLMEGYASYWQRRYEEATRDQG